MKRWHLIIDVEQCENCNNCFLACKDEHCGNDWPGYAAAQPLHGHRWINIRRKERGRFPTIDVAYLPMPCMHCDDPPCRRADRNGAVVKRPDGIVLIDPERARGQKALVGSCPYGAIWWNEDRQVAQKCTCCAHLLDSGWQEPRCVQACPTGALSVRYVDDDEMKRLAQRQGLEVIRRGTASCRPSVYYRNLHRFRQCFIAGSLATGAETTADCVAGATVTLYQNGMPVAKSVSDAFGDFKFDRIAPDSGTYSLDIDAPATGSRTVQVDVKESCSLGTIWL